MTTQFRSHNGTWHVASTEQFTVGQHVQVSRRSGNPTEVIIVARVAHDPARELPYLYTFEDVRRASGAQPASRTETIANADRLFDLFERAASAARTPHHAANHQARANAPAVRFALTNTARGLRLEMAGMSSRYAGQLLALAQQRSNTGRRTMYGSMSRDGRFVGTVGATQVELDIFNEVATLLRGFAADPAGYAAAHGRATGNCCFCGRGLTDERSVAVGYGPICADYYGLPWGDANEPAFNVAAGSTRQLERLGDNAGRPNAFDGSDRLETIPLEGIRQPVDVTIETHELRPDRLASPHINAQGEIINRTAHGIETATGRDLDGWAAQFNVLRRRDGRTRTDDELRAAILDAQRSLAANVPSLEDILNTPIGMDRAAMASNRASAGLPNIERDAMGNVRMPAVAAAPVRAGEPVSLVQPRPDQVVTTVRRVRPAAAPAAPARPRISPLERLRQRHAERQTAARQGAQAPTDETTTTVVRAVRRDPNTPLEEDDFIWPPRNIENHTGQE